MKNIDINELLLFHNKIVDKTGGSKGVRDENLLISALNRANMTFGGQDLYCPIERKIAVTAHSLISNHGFIDGNKRIGVAVLILLCKINGIILVYTQKELIDLGLGVASGNINEEQIYNWIEEHKKKL